MKKVILTEDQIKRMMDKLILNEQVSTILPDNSKRLGSTNESGKYKLCDFFVIKEGGRWFLETEEKERIEIPKLSDIKGTITLTSGTPKLILDPLVKNGYRAGNYVGTNSIESECWKYVRAGMETWFVYVDPDYKGLVGDKSKGTEELKSYGEIPVFCGLIRRNDPNNPTEFSTGKFVEEEEGQIVQTNETYTQNFKFSFARGLGAKTIGGGDIPSKPVETPNEDPIVLTFEKGLNDAFNFDQITLNDEGNKNLQDLINYAKQNYQGVSANVPVICSASIDADPNQIVKGNMKRSDYNLQLSKRRADSIANMLTTQIGIDTLKFIPQGIGETDQYDPGKKYPEVKDKNQTAGNRKLIIQLPKLQKTIQKR